MELGTPTDKGFTGLKIKLKVSKKDDPQPVLSPSREETGFDATMNDNNGLDGLQFSIAGPEPKLEPTGDSEFMQDAPSMETAEAARPTPPRRTPAKRKSPIKGQKKNNGTRNKQPTNNRKKRKQAAKNQDEPEEEWVENVKVDLSEGIRRSQRQRQLPSRFVVYQRIDDDLLQKKEGDEGDNAIDFVDTLHDRVFGNAAEVVQIHQNGENITYEKMFVRDGFRTPLLILEPTGLDLRVPNRDFDVDSVARLVGNRDLDVIDVRKQSEVPNWKMENWANYYNQPTEERTQILNVISLEFSDSKLADLVQSPGVVRKVDWVDNIWPRELKERALKAAYVAPEEQNTTTITTPNPLGTPSTQHAEEQNGKRRKVLPLAYYPKVQYYCLMSVKGSYTDFHIDFGGSSVWYHIVYGGKVFYMIRPTKTNLKLYAKWLSDPGQSQKFFGDMVDKCYKVVLNPGNTFMIPSGWIHAVFTPEDSLVFGGNFLHGFSISKQLKVFDIENQSKTRKKFRFPLYESMQWYAMRHYTAIMKDQTKPPIGPHERKGLIAMARRLRQWKDRAPHRQHIPLEIDAENGLSDFEALLGIEPIIEPPRRRATRSQEGEEEEGEEEEGEEEEGDEMYQPQQAQQQLQQQGGGGMGDYGFMDTMMPPPPSTDSIESLHAMPFTSSSTFGFGFSSAPTPTPTHISPSSTPVAPKSVKVVLKRPTTTTTTQDQPGSESQASPSSGGGEGVVSQGHMGGGVGGGGGGVAVVEGKRVRRSSAKKLVQEEEDEEEEEEELIEEISEDEAAELMADRDGGEYVVGKASRPSVPRAKPPKAEKKSTPKPSKKSGGGSSGGSPVAGGSAAAASPKPAPAAGGGGGSSAGKKQMSARERLLKKIGSKPSAIHQSWRKR